MKTKNVVDFTTVQEKSKQFKEAPEWLCGHMFGMIPKLIGRDERLRRIEIVVLIAIASHSDNNGKSWASLETLSKETGYHTGRVSVAIRNLISFGYIKRTRRGPDKNNNNQTNLYFISFETLEKDKVSDCNEKDLTTDVKLENADLTTDVKLESSDLTTFVSSDLTTDVKQTYQEHTNKEEKEKINKKEKSQTEAEPASPPPKVESSDSTIQSENKKPKRTVAKPNQERLNDLRLLADDYQAKTGLQALAFNSKGEPTKTGKKIIKLFSEYEKKDIGRLNVWAAEIIKNQEKHHPAVVNRALFSELFSDKWFEKNLEASRNGRT